MKSPVTLSRILARFHYYLLKRDVRERLLASPPLQELYETCSKFNKSKLLATAITDTRFVVIDTETTGFHAYAGDQIVSIGMLEYQGLQPTGEHYYQLINPQRPIPESSTRIHGIRDQDVKDAPRLEDAMPEIVQFMHNSVLVGHHVQFDIRFLNRNLHAWLGCKLKHPWLDTMLMYLAWSGQYGHYELEQVAQRCNVELQQRHNALGDAQTAAAIFTCLADKLVDPHNTTKTLINQQHSDV